MPESLPSPEEAYLKVLKNIGPAPSPEGDAKPISRRSFLAHHDAHPFALDILLLKTFGPQYYDWEWETIRMELQRLFSTTISELNFNKIEAMRTLHRSDGPWRKWEVFEKVIQAINNNVPRFDIMQKCSLPQVWNGVKIMSQVRKERFDGDVPQYTAAVFKDEGVEFCPGVLAYARPLVNQRPEVSKALRTYTPDRTLEENVVDIQVAKLLVAKNYVDMRDSQLKQQLAMMKEMTTL